MPALLIAQRNTARHVPELLMRCDATEFVDLPGDPKPDWWAGMGVVEGSLPWEGNQAPPLPRINGLITIAVRGRQFGAIIAPEHPQAPAAWLAADLAQCRVQADGAQGTFRKRPTSIDINAPDWGLTVFSVTRVYQSGRTRRGQPGQENSLLAAVTGNAA